MSTCASSACRRWRSPGRNQAPVRERPSWAALAHPERGDAAALYQSPSRRASVHEQMTRPGGVVFRPPPVRIVQLQVADAGRQACRPGAERQAQPHEHAVLVGPAGPGLDDLVARDQLGVEQGPQRWGEAQKRRRVAVVSPAGRIDRPSRSAILAATNAVAPSCRRSTAIASVSTSSLPRSSWSSAAAWLDSIRRRRRSA